LVSVTVLSMLVTGCSPSRPFYFFDDANLSHYKGAATEIEYPDVETQMLADVSQALPPLTLANNEPREIWDLTLEDAMQNAMANSKVLRTLGGTPVTNSNIQVASINNARLLLGPTKPRPSTTRPFKTRAPVSAATRSAPRPRWLRSTPSSSAN